MSIISDLIIGTTFEEGYYRITTCFSILPAVLIRRSATPLTFRYMRLRLNLLNSSNKKLEVYQYSVILLTPLLHPIPYVGYPHVA